MLWCVWGQGQHVEQLRPRCRVLTTGEQPGGSGNPKAERAAATAYTKAQRPLWKKRVITPAVFVSLAILALLPAGTTRLSGAGER